MAEAAVASRTLEALLHPFSFLEDARDLVVGEYERRKRGIEDITIVCIAGDLISAAYGQKQQQQEGEALLRHPFDDAILQFAHLSALKPVDITVSYDAQTCNNGDSEEDEQYQSTTSTDGCESENTDITVPLPNESPKVFDTFADSAGSRSAIISPPIDDEVLPLITYKTDTSPDFETASFAIGSSSIAGFGAFATRHLQCGDVILRERPLFIATSDTLYEEFSKLDAVATRVALGLHANNHLKDGQPRIASVWTTNCFAIEPPATAGLFPVAARFNHACRPNVVYTYDATLKVLQLRIKEESVRAGEELTISYGHRRTPLDLYLCYGFRCRCGACDGVSEEDMGHLNEPW